jgi:phosphoglucosamine mutase
MRSLFGTDGIRGEAGRPPLDPDTVSRVGAALVATLRNGGAKEISIVLGCDTRASSLEIAESLAGGVLAAGGSVRFAGVVTTPGVAWLTNALGAAAGVVISASHNPWTDNGIKIFSASGRKLPDEVEAAIEREIAAAAPASAARLTPEDGLAALYVSHLVATLPQRLDGLTVVVDAAHGAAYRVGPAAFEAAGARVVPLCVAPDGRNINEECGALHPQAMCHAVVAHGADLGIALDGDADRILVSDETGALLDGDDVLWLWTLELIREGKKPRAIVGTVMSNWGLEHALAGEDVRLIRAAVGDRYVAEEMQKEGALLGGEPSGHLIRSDLTTTGDGILTGLHLAAFLAASGKRLSGQPRIVRTPQVLKNVRVTEKVPFEKVPGFAEEWTRCEREMDGTGRILLRYSGTEALARVMVEGIDAALVESVAGRLARTIQDAIGSGRPAAP